jgi:hypothetical protein
LFTTCICGGCLSQLRSVHELCPWGKRLKLDRSHWSQNTHSGCHKPALLRHHVQQSGTHPALIASEQLNERKNAACSQCARALPVVQDLEVGQFPLEPNTKSLNIHSGCHKTALLSCYVRPSGTHPALSVPARNGAGAKALPVLNVHELCSGCKSSKLDRSHCSGAACGRV